MKEEKAYTEGISMKESKFLSWFDNFWYHYKWHTIVTVFIVIVLTFCLVQSCSKKENDIIFTYAGPKEFVSDPAEKIEINAALSEFSGETYGENATAILRSFEIYSKEQIKEIENELLEEAEKTLDETNKPKKTINTAFNTEEMNSFEDFLRSGATYVLLLDPSIYQTLIDSEGNTERLVELSSIYGSTPENARDKYSVRLGDTEIYKSNPALQALPADTVVCLHNKLIATKQNVYDMQLDVFKRFAVLSKTEIESESVSESESESESNIVSNEP